MIPSSHHGRFSGSNRLWFMPGTPAHVSDGTLVVAADRISVHWAHEGASKAGELVLRGPAPSCRADFTDTFHAAGDGFPDWGWRIVIDWCDPDHFSLRMFNVLPDGTEALAVDLRGARTNACSVMLPGITMQPSGVLATSVAQNNGCVYVRAT